MIGESEGERKVERVARSIAAGVLVVLWKEEELEEGFDVRLGFLER
jgi:hypothetical protein